MILGSPEINNSVLDEAITRAESLLTICPYEDYRSLLEIQLLFAGNSDPLALSTQEKIDSLAEEINTLCNEAEKEMGQTSEPTDLEKLQNLYDKYISLEQGNYTDESWKTFEEALAKAELVLTDENPSITAIRSACTALLKAYLDLEESELLNTVYLEKLLEEAKAIDTKNIRPALAKVLEDAIEEAENVLMTATVQQQINEMATKLFIAIINLKDIVSREDIEELLKLADQLNDQDYTEESWKKVEDAVKDAVKLSDDSSQSEIDTVYDAFCDALENLKKKDPGVNKSALKNALDDTELILANIEDFIPSTVKGLEDIYKRAKDVYENAAAAQAEIDAITKELATANAKARVKEDKSLLEKNVKEAAEIDARLYTAVSYKVLEKALEEAWTVLEDEEATAEEIAAAIKLIEEAKAQLEAIDTDATDDSEDQSQSVDTGESESVSSSDGTDDSKGKSQSENTGKSGGKSSGKVRTGDPADFTGLLMIMIGSLTGIVVLYRRRRKLGN